MIALRFILIILLVATVIFGIHYFLYVSLIRFFSITNLQTKTIIASVIALLSFSFVVSSVLAHFYQGKIIRYLYFGSSVWLGILENLILFSILGWIIIFIAKYANIAINYNVMAIILLAGALIFSVYGLYNASQVRVKKLDIEIKNLPIQWKGKKVVQLSDVHLGNIYQANFLEKVVQETNSLKPDVIFITGDLFDGMNGDLSQFIKPLNELSAPEGIYFITGNHEIYLGLNIVFDILEKTKIKVISDDVIDINGLQVIGINYPATEETQDMTKIVTSNKNWIKGKPTIMLHHVPTQISEAKSLGVNLQLSGHTHRGQLFPLNFITEAVFKGYDYGIKQEGDFSIYTSPGTGTWGPPMRTNSQSEIVEITLK